MRRVLMTGATGYIGGRLLRRLISEGIEVAVLARDRTRLPADLLPRLEVVEGGLDRIEALAGRFSGSYDVFYHLAWQGVAPEGRNDFDLQMQNIPACAACVRAAAALKIPRFVFPGSTMEYLYNGRPINALAVPSCANAYGAAKIAAHYLAEEQARQLGVGFLYAVATSVYGVGREDGNVLFYVMEKLMKREKPSVTKLEQPWDYIHIDDLTGALLAIGERGRPGAFYAIGNGENHPLAEYLKLVRDLIDPALPLGIGEIPYPGGRRPSSCIDPAALREDTGFVPAVSFEAGMREVVHYYRQKWGCA